METRKFRVDGMTCVNCQSRIENKLKNTAGIRDASVNYVNGEAAVTFDGSITGFGEIAAAIESLGYTTASRGKATLRIAGVLLIVLALSVLLRAFGTSSLATAFPLAQAGMGYGMLFLIGVLTSVHCIAMCGGINLSQSLAAKNAPQSPVPSPRSLLLPGLLYNGGRLISYTAVGVLVGALGSVVSVTGRFQGAVLLIVGLFMVIMGINMLGLFPVLRRVTPRLPGFLSKKISGQNGRGPLIVGVLNGFMPCGPLQAMQLYALSTGSPLRGGLAMFLFCIGTVPLMFGLGAAGSVLSGVKGRAFSRRVMQVGALVIAAMGVTMFTNGWSLTGLASPLEKAAAFIGPASGPGAFTPVIRNGVQIVNSTLLPSRYPAITVQEGIPVRWTINAPPGSITGCNNRIFIREYGIEYTFKPGDNVIEFLPAKAGRFRYSCWMAMIHSTITVLAEGDNAAEVLAAYADPTPKPAGVKIPTDSVAVAQVVEIRGENCQMVEMHLTDEGFEPAIAVMQRRLRTFWVINLDSADSENGLLIIPAYYSQLNIQPGGNVMQLIPEGDFDFSTGDNKFYGYVKVVDDISNVDIEAVKAEAAGHETLVYPEAHFEAALGGGGGCACCQ